MDLLDVLSEEPLRWAEFLQVILGLEGWASAVALLGVVSASLDGGVTWMLQNGVWPGWLPRPVTEAERRVWTGGVPVVVVLLAAILAIVGGYAPATMDTVFGGLQVAGFVAFGAVLTRAGLQAKGRGAEFEGGPTRTLP
jgi:hypothetical protein